MKGTVFCVIYDHSYKSLFWLQEVSKGGYFKGVFCRFTISSYIIQFTHFPLQQEE